MAYLPNQTGALFVRLQRLLGLRTPFPSSTQFLPFVLVNAPDAYSEKQRIFSGTSTGTLGFAGDRDHDVYVTGVEISAADIQVIASSVENVTVSVVIAGVTREIARLTYTVGGGARDIFIPFHIPIKIDTVASNIVIADSAAGLTNVTVTGYQL